MSKGDLLPAPLSLTEAEARYRDVIQETEKRRERARVLRTAAIREALTTRTYRDVADELGVHNSYLVRLMQDANQSAK